MANREERTFQAQGTGPGKKFWAISLFGTTVRVRFGKVGTKGSQRDLNQPSEHLAEVLFASQIESKLNKGYKETTGAEGVGGEMKLRSGKPTYDSVFAVVPQLDRLPGLPRVSELPGLSKLPAFLSLSLDADDDD